MSEPQDLGNCSNRNVIQQDFVHHKWTSREFLLSEELDAEVVNWFPEISLGTGNLRRDSVSFHLELAWAPEGASGSDLGEARLCWRGCKEMKGRQWTNGEVGECQLCVDSGHPGPAPAKVINATQLLLVGHEVPCHSLYVLQRDLLRLRIVRSAPGCAGLPAGAPSCTSFQPQNAPGAHRCSSRRDEIRDTGKQEHMDGVPSALRWKATWRPSSANSCLCDLGCPFWQ